VNGKSCSVLVTVNKKDSGTPFGHWFNALGDAITKAVVGTVVVWPRAALAVGKQSASYKSYAKRLDEGTLRPFPLDENEGTFHQLECLRQISGRAGSDLVLNGNLISKDRCRELILETGVLANLKLFEFVFQNWKGLPAPATVALPAPPPPPAPKPPTPAAAPVSPPPTPTAARPTPAATPAPPVAPPPPPARPPSRRGPT
jgi:hypothetical protein